jgi:hypothetical protein
MRTSLSILASVLLAPYLALAQYGPDNTPANTQGNGAYRAPATPQNNNGYPASGNLNAASAPAAPGAAPGENLTPAACHARMQEYLASLACFEPYRHGPHVIDIEAFKHCKVVKEPTDCEAQGMR